MSFRFRIIALLLLVSTIPVIVSMFLASRASDTEIVARIEDLQRASAKPTAESVNTLFRDVVDAVRLSTEIIPFEDFPPGELAGALRIPFNQFDFINIAVLLDSEAQQLTAPIFETYSDPAEKDRYRESTSLGDLEAFGRNIPFLAAQAGGAAFGPVYVSAQSHTPRVVLAVGIPLKRSQNRWVLAVELSLRRVVALAESAVPSNGTVYIVDNEKEIVFHSDPQKMKVGRMPENSAILAEGFAKKGVVSKRFTTEDDTEMAGTFAWIPVLGWGLVTEQPVATAFQSLYRLRNYTASIMVVTIVIALAGGFMLARGLSRPLTVLARRASEIATGSFGRPIRIRSRGEIGQLASAFNHMSSELQQLLRQHEKLFISSIHTLITAVEAKDKYTRGHSERVTYLTVAICELMNLGDHDKEIAELAGLLHDVGKIGVPEHVLNKAGTLNGEEYAIIREHPASGAKIVQQIEHANVYEVAAVVRAHHEYWDGSGYPEGLRGEEIPLVARIMAVADAYDAMTTDRAYRKGIDSKSAVVELRRVAGMQFDKRVVDVFGAAVESNRVTTLRASKYVVSEIPERDEGVRDSYNGFVEIKR